MAWKVGDAKQRFSELLRRAEREPQVIQNRDRVVAVVMGPLDAARAMRAAAPAMKDALADLRRLAAETDYTLTLPKRTDRPVDVSWATHVPRRHQRLK